MTQGVPGTVQHGSRTCYNQGCRREECAAANAAYKRRKRLADRPSEPYHLSLVNAEPFQAVIQELRKSHPLQVIAEVCGVSRYDLTLIALGHRQRIRLDTARKLRRGLLSMLPESA